MNRTPIPLAWCGDQADFTRMMIALANQRQLAMRGMSKRVAFHYVETIIADAEVVIGVWQDPSGVGLHVIKGLRHLMTATANGEPARGTGEPTVTVVAPAIGNAIFNAVGARVRSLPITAEAVKAAMKA